MASIQIGSQVRSINVGNKAVINEEVELPIRGSRSSIGIELDIEFYRNPSVIAHPDQILIPITPETEELVEGLYSEGTSADSDNQKENNVIITEYPDSKAYGIQYSNN